MERNVNYHSDGKGAGEGRFTWIVCPKSQHDIATWIQNERIPPHRRVWEICLRDIGVGKVTRVLLRSPDSLESMAVQMERVLARIVIVHDNLDNLALLEDKGVRPRAVHFGIGGVAATAEDRVQRRDFWFHVGDVAKEGVVGAVCEIVHDDGQADLLVRVGVEGLVVKGNEGPVVEFVEYVVLNDGSVGIGVG